MRRCRCCNAIGEMCHYVASDGVTRCVNTDVAVGVTSLALVNPVPVRRRDDPVASEALSHIRAQYHRRQARRTRQTWKTALGLVLLTALILVLGLFASVLGPETPAEIQYIEQEP